MLSDSEEERVMGVGVATWTGVMGGAVATWTGVMGGAVATSLEMSVRSVLKGAAILDISTMSAEGGRGPGGNNTSLESATAVTSEEG